MQARGKHQRPLTLWPQVTPLLGDPDQQLHVGAQDAQEMTQPATDDPMELPSEEADTARADA
eukprot:14739280-Alexandrium_andersonii.AAC.1